MAGQVKKDNHWLSTAIDGQLKKVPQPSRDEVAIAEKFLSDPEATRRLTFGIEAVANAVRMVAASGLTEEALCMLIQYSIGYDGKNLVSTRTISKVLVAAANLDKRYMEPEALEAAKEKKR